MTGNLSNKLASALPDIPRHVETRSLLLSGCCWVLAVVETPALSFVTGSSELDIISVVGRPDTSAIREGVRLNRRRGAVLAPPEARDYVAAVLPDWRGILATLHLLGESPRLPHLPAGSARLVTSEELNGWSHIPAELKREMLVVSRRSPVAAVFEGTTPVSFCYVAAETEGLWDISIDTLAEYRNRGHASSCVAFLIGHMSALGKRPVWGAEHDNPASLSLAAKLGFVPVDEIVVFREEIPSNDRAA